MIFNRYETVPNFVLEEADQSIQLVRHFKLLGVLKDGRQRFKSTFRRFARESTVRCIQSIRIRVSICSSSNLYYSNCLFNQALTIAHQFTRLQRQYILVNLRAVLGG